VIVILTTAVEVILEPRGHGKRSSTCFKAIESVGPKRRGIVIIIWSSVLIWYEIWSEMLTFAVKEI
jgi:hypothetical protein